MHFTLQKKLHTAQGKSTLHAELQVEQGELLVITGPSGSGKTSLLRMIAGLLKPEQGLIEVDGNTWLDTRKKISLPSRERKVGMVFQEYALFPNMTVRQNLEYALQSGEADDMIRELTGIMEIEELVNRYPETLSGGQQQRVAVARALVRQPRLLLLDEPLSALDPAMRNKLQDHILKVHYRYGLTTLMVSHDAREISKMAQRVVRLEHGILIDEGAPLTENGKIGHSEFTGLIKRLSLDGPSLKLEVLVGDAVLSLAFPKGMEVGFHPGDEIRLALKKGEFRIVE